MLIHHAQRQHIISSLDSFVYKLQALSFLLSPSVWIYICRVITQWQFSRPRDFDSSSSLRYLFLLPILLNIAALWSHATEGASNGRSVVLDFVGIAHAPSKVHLLFVDFLIISLDMLLVAIAFETASLRSKSPDTTSSDVPSSSDLLSSNAMEIPIKTADTTYVIDIRLSSILRNLWDPPPPPPPSDQPRTDLLPLPNTTPRISNALRMMMGTGGLVRARPRAAERTAGRQERGSGSRDTDAREPGSVPGGFDSVTET